MSSPLTSYVEDSSLKARENEMDKSSMSMSYDVNFSFAETQKNELLIDYTIAGLKKCLQTYEEKARSCENLLEKIGFTVMDLPECLRTELREACKDDDGVFNFPQASEQLATINAEHVLDSLQENYELVQLRMLRSQMETLLEEFSWLNSNLERKLSTEEEVSAKLENKRFDREADLMIFKQKLEKAKRELDKWQELSQGQDKPRYSVEELESMKQEVSHLKAEIAHTDVKLNKYSKLPLSEKDVQKQILRIKDNIKNLDNEMRTRLEV